MALPNQADLFTTVLENLTSLVSHFDRDFRYLYVNAAFERWFQINRDACLDRKIVDIVGPSAFRDALPFISKALDGEAQDAQIEVQFDNGRRRTFHVRYLPVRDHKGHVNGVISIVDDISELVNKTARFQEIYDASPLAIGVLDQNLSFIQTNQAFQHLLGFLESDIAEKSFSKMIAPGDHNMTTFALNLMLSGQFPARSFETRASNSLGHMLILRLTGRPIPGPLGKSNLLLICEDVTDQRIIEDEFKSALEFNEAIIRSTASAIIATDLNGVITEFNETAEFLLGYHRSEVVHVKTPELFHIANEVVEAASKLSKEMKCEMQPGFETLTFHARNGGYEEREWTYRKKDGSLVPVRLTVTGLYDHARNLTGFLGLANDITDFTQLQKQLDLEKAKATHTSKLASLGEMSAGVAHEINNPLGIIMGSLPLLEKFKDNPSKFQSKLENIAHAGKRIEKIVKGLRRFARTTDHQERRETRLQEIVAEAFVITDAKAKRHSISVLSEFAADPLILCDGVEIEQVIVNLINNAIDANKDAVERWILIRIYESDETAFISVTDSGAGITRDVEDKLFLPFFTTKEVGEGTGLGLSIAKGIIEDHAGTLTVDHSSPNTRFEIRLPKNAKVSHAV